MPHLLKSYLYRTSYNDMQLNYNMDTHPLKLSFFSKSNEIMEALAEHLDEHRSIKFSEEQFWMFANCTNKLLRDTVLGSLFNHCEIDDSKIEKNVILNEENLPIFKKLKDNYLEDSKFETTSFISSSMNAVTLEVFRSPTCSDWSLSDPLVSKFLKIFGENPTKIIDNPSKYLVSYLWNRYSTLYRLLALIYIIFVASTTINMVWCNTSDECDKFSKTGSVLFYGIKVVSYLSFMILLF